MADYKDTINLPKTAFPMRANLPQREPKLLARWQEQGIYQQLRKVRAGKPRYLLHDGPPYANGDIHLGHVVNKVLKDIIVKARSMDGLDAPYVPGWDCHGLPIEHQVEKKLGKAGVKVPVAEFRAACRAYAARQVQVQREGFERLGVIGDWQHPYLTMDPVIEADTVRALGQIVAGGYVYQGEKPVHWCLDCGSALAEAEVDYADRESPSIDVRFDFVDAAAVADICGVTQPDGPLSLAIWTTTPWTLPANRAVSLHPQITYEVVRLPDGAGLVMVARELREQACARYGAGDCEVVGQCQGRQLEGQLLQHPFLDIQVPVILGEHVTTEAGTGAVHTAPGHGHDDYQAGQRYGLEVYNPVTGNGTYVQDMPLFGGQHIFAANDAIIALLRERGKLLHSATISHSYPHCWRHKTPTIVRTTPQWFIGMERGDLRQRALREIAKTNWIPAWGETRIESMIANRPDWCISRQRTWGVPITLFVHRQTGALHPDTERLIEEVAGRIEQQGVEAWFALDAAELLGDQAAEYDQVTDVLDVWFDSGVTHATVLDRREELGVPADLYLEGSDQHRGWFHSSLLTSVAMRDAAPYRGVLTHGFAVDAEGKKMSKSRGNVVAPDQVIKRLGADILRLWVAATDYRGEMHVSDEILTRIADAYRRIRNTARYLLGNLHDFQAEVHLLPAEDLLALDRWALAEASALDEALRGAYETFEFHQVYHRLHNFCSVRMGGFYLDVIKDRLYTLPADSIGRRSAQTAMHHILQGLVRWLAPVLSFTAEEIWQEQARAHGAGPLRPQDPADSVLLQTWYPFGELMDGRARAEATAAWEAPLRAREAVGPLLERLRADGAIGASLDADVVIYAGDDLHDALAGIGDELHFVLITSTAVVLPASQRPAEAVELAPDLWARVRPSEAPKCGRCWHHSAQVGDHPEHPELCPRCVTNVTAIRHGGDGEVRRFA